MRRYAVWLLSALPALAAYALANASGLSWFLALVVTFIGAMAGAVIANAVLPRR